MKGLGGRRVARARGAGRAARWVALVIVLAALAPPAARAQEVAPPDSLPATPPPDAPEAAPEPTTPSPYAPPPPESRVTSRLRRSGQERDRFELGAAIPDGYFDVLGTLGYRRLLREGGPFQHAVHVELAGGWKDYLGEGTLSVYYFLRPLASFKEEWRVRPLLEIGPGAHLVVQTADIEGFGDDAFRSRFYFKTHSYAGVELLITPSVGLMVRGRVSVPAHHPFDYAQAAILLR